mmetsp:Transcript_7576/g.12249  ORF Transcript_7576/g.12249 Transcript_7576/m.12249 type:complete len:225 (-) Transcript_7576:148-822(-)
MVQQTKHGPIIRAVFKCQMKIAMTASVSRLAGIRILDHEVVDYTRIARALNGNAQRQISILICPRYCRCKTREHGLEHDLFHDIAITKQQMDRQVPILISTLGAREILRQETRDDAHVGMVPTRNVQWQAAPTLLARAVYHGVRALGSIGEEELDRLRGIELGRDVDRLTAAGIDIVDAFLVGAVDDFKGGNVVVRSGVMEGQGSNGILVKQCLGVENKDHVHE